MTRNAKIQKLANAVKAYRGANTVIVNETNGTVKTKWLISPQCGKRTAIVKWLKALGRDNHQIEQDAIQIDGFKTRAQFESWIQSL